MKVRTFKHKKRGIIAEIHGDIARICKYEFPTWMLENDTWQDITKDYEILRRFTLSEASVREIISVKRLFDGSVFSVGEVYDSRRIRSFREIDNTIIVYYDDGTWHYLRSVQPKKDYEILEAFHSNNQRVTYGIKTIKRLRDDKVFSIKDYVYHLSNPSKWKGEITKIQEQDNSIKFTFGDRWVGYLHEIQKSRQPILTSEDGVELFEGDKGYVYDKVTGKSYHIRVSARTYCPDDYTYYSSREAAEEYRLYNARVLSYKDMMDVAFNSIKMDVAFNSIKLKKLIKSRLG